MRLELGPTPPDERCAQVGDPDFSAKNRKECADFIQVLETMFPNRPEGCEFVITTNSHDFGSYREVAVTYNERPETKEFAFNVERNLPAKWPETKSRALGAIEEILLDRGWNDLGEGRWSFNNEVINIT